MTFSYSDRLLSGLDEGHDKEQYSNQDIKVDEAKKTVLRVNMVRSAKPLINDLETKKPEEIK